MIMFISVDSENKRNALRKYKDRIFNAYLGHKITLEEKRELESIIDSKIALFD